MLLSLGIDNELQLQIPLQREYLGGDRKMGLKKWIEPEKDKGRKLLRRR